MQRRFSPTIPPRSRLVWWLLVVLLLHAVTGHLGATGATGRAADAAWRGGHAAVEPAPALAAAEAAPRPGTACEQPTAEPCHCAQGLATLDPLSDGNRYPAAPGPGLRPSAPPLASAAGSSWAAAYHRPWATAPPAGA